MKKFQFRLDAVMKVYKIHKDHAQAALHERLAEDQRAKQKLLICQQALESSTELADQRHLETQSVADLLQHRLYLHRLTEEFKQQKGVCGQTQKEVDQARAVLVEANRRTQTIENLKSKQFEQYRQDMLRKEQNVMDEIGVRKHQQTWPSDMGLS
ncbi:MAG: flagellar export protein FliJ, partial [Bacillota bacterium]